MAIDKEKSAKKQSVGVLIDMGNSETRVRVKYRPIKGIAGAQVPVENTFSMSNKYANIGDVNKIDVTYMNSASTIFDIGGGYPIGHGAIQAREYAKGFDEPSGAKDKYSQPITRWTIMNCLLKTIHLLADAWGVSPKEVDVAFVVYCLVPPEEHLNHRKEVIELIENIDEIVEYVPNAEEQCYEKVKYPIICKDIQVYPEGISAFAGIRVNITGNKVTPNKDVEKFMKGIVLIMDIGSGTTDLALMQDGMLLTGSRRTVSTAGKYMLSLLDTNMRRTSDVIRSNHIKLTNIDSIMNSAKIYEEDGLIDIDCSAELNEAKNRLAEVLANEIKDWAVSQDLISRTRGILVVGGANMTATREGEVVSPALATFLVPKIKEFASLAEMVEIRNRDPRYLNLDGIESIYIMHQNKSADTNG